MTQNPKILGPDCSCGNPMTWYRVELVGQLPVNVYRCDSCDKLAAQAAHATLVVDGPDRRHERQA
jgi:hypothetical protein